MIRFNPILLVIFASFCIGAVSDHFYMMNRINEIHLEQAQKNSQDIQLSLKQFKEHTERINRTAAQLADSESAISAKVHAIQKGLKNAPALAHDCRPDSIRMRALTDAIESTNPPSGRPSQ